MPENTETPLMHRKKTGQKCGYYLGLQYLQGCHSHLPYTRTRSDAVWLLIHGAQIDRKQMFLGIEGVSAYPINAEKIDKNVEKIDIFVQADDKYHYLPLDSREVDFASSTKTSRKQRRLRIQDKNVLLKIILFQYIALLWSFYFSSKILAYLLLLKTFSGHAQVMRQWLISVLAVLRACDTNA